MKKHILLSFLIFLCQMSFGQSSCMEENVSNAFENGLAGFSDFYAADITISADTDMSLTSISTNLWTDFTTVTVDAADIIIYEDDNGLPGTVIATYAGLVPTSDVELMFPVGTFGLSGRKVDFDIPATNLAGQTGAETAYWISINNVVVSTGSYAYHEISTATIVGNEAVSSSDNGVTWSVSTGNELVYNFGGDCTPIPVIPDCFEENVSNSYEQALPSNSNGLFPYQILATDLTIPADTNMSLTSINANLWIEYNNVLGGGSIVDAEITIYNDASGLPGSEVASYTEVVPSSQPLLIGMLYGGHTFVDVFDVTFDIPATDLAGQVGIETTYWVSIHFTIDGTDAYNGDWEVTTTSSVGNQAAFSLDYGTTWYISQDFDAVYNFGGNCTSMPLSIEDNNLFEGFSYYPNPMNSSINLSANNKIKSIVIYNLLGQEILRQEINTTLTEINVSELSSGNYIMKVNIDGIINSFKLIKI